MPVTAKLEMGSMRLLNQQSTTCRTELINDTRSSLRGVNPGNWPGCATIVMTDVKSGASSRFARRQRPVPDAFAPAVAPGEKLLDQFSWAEIVVGPQPGVYDVQAVYEWSGGMERAASAPVRVELLPANPWLARAAYLRGVAGPNAACVWLARSDPAGQAYQVWLSKIATVLKPRVRDCFRLAEVKWPVDPFLSVPPNAPPLFAWTAWIDGSTLTYVVQSAEEVLEPGTVAIGEPGFRIIPPLLEVPPQRGSPSSRVDVLTLQEEPRNSGWRMHVSTLRLSGGSVAESEILVPGPAPAWAETAHLSGGVRRTFFLWQETGKCRLGMSRWSAMRPPQPPAELTAFSGRFLASSIALTPEDVVLGAMIMDNEQGEGRYVIRRWYCMPNEEFGLAEERVIGLDGAIEIEQALVRVAVDAAPFALLKASGHPQWHFCRNDGAVSEAPAGVCPPLDILFRYGTDPTIMYADPGRGLQFARPG